MYLGKQRHYDGLDVLQRNMKNIGVQLIDGIVGGRHVLKSVAGGVSSERTTFGRVIGSCAYLFVSGKVQTAIDAMGNSASFRIRYFARWS